MSELLGEARVLIRPDTTTFRGELRTEIEKAIATTGPIPVPVQLAPVSAGAVTTVTASQSQLTSALTATNEAQARQNSLVAQGAVILDAEAIAASADAAAMEALGFEQSKAAVSTKSVATAQKAGVAASEALALSYADVATAASAVGVAQVQATRAAAAVADAEAAVAAALKASNIALIDAASRALALAESRNVEAIAALKAARAEAEHAATLGAVGKAGIASGASMLGLRGAVLTAGAAFLGATVGIQALGKAIGESTAKTEELNKTDVIFRRSAAAVKEWSETTAQSFGIASEAALEAANNFGNIFVPLGVLPRQAAVLSQSLVELAADMASFNNVDPGRALEALRAGLVGQSRPLRVLGVQLTAARVEQEAMRETGKKLSSELTQQEKILARYSLILQDTAIQQGDFARTQERLANQSRILKAQLADLGDTIGSGITPLLTDMARGVNLTISGFQRAGDAIGVYGSQLKGAKEEQGGFIGAMRDFRKTLTQLLAVTTGGALVALSKIFPPGESEKVKADLDDIMTRLAGVGEESRKAFEGPALIVAISEELRGLIALLGQGGPKAKEFQQALATLLSDIQRTGKVPLNLEIEFRKIFFQQELDRVLKEAQDLLDHAFGAALPATLTLDVKIAVAEAKGQDLLPLLLEQRKKQQKELDRLLALPRGAPGRKNIQDQANALTATNNEIERIQREQAAAIKAQGDAAKSNQEKANQNFLARQALARQQAENIVTAAGLDEANVRAQIKAEVALRELLESQIRAIKKSALSERDKAEAIASLVSAKLATQAAINQLKAQQAREKADRKNEIQELNIQIAEERGNQAALRRAINIRIKTLDDQIAKARKDQVKVKQLILERERLRNQLKDLNKADQETRNGFKTFVFEQLQAQQGFAANLLGNIIRGPTTGLVGVPSPSGIPLPNVDDAIKVGQGAAAARQGGSPTAGQQNTVIALLERILTTLKQANRADASPEAKFERKQGSAALDGVGGGGTNAVM